jgi:hypothetical protein
MSKAASRAKILRLYKDILSSAKQFPSIKKFKIIDEIKVGFKQYKSSTDDNEIQARINLAIDGLSKLSMYSNLSHSSRSWVVNMDKQPMPKKEEKAKDNNSNAIVTDDTIATSSTTTAKIDHPKL